MNLVAVALQPRSSIQSLSEGGAGYTGYLQIESILACF